MEQQNITVDTKTSIKTNYILDNANEGLLFFNSWFH